MYSSKLKRKIFYHFKLGREIFVVVLLYFVIIIWSYLFWPQKWNYEYFSILNQLLLPLLSCMWINACVREWYESEHKEILFYYSRHFYLRQLADVIIFQILLIVVYAIPCVLNYEVWNNVLIQIIVCFLFQTIYCLGLLIVNSSTLVLFVIAVVEVINVMAYLRNVNSGWYIFLRCENMQINHMNYKYLWFLITGIVIWAVDLILYIQKKKEEDYGSSKQ